MGVPAFFRWLTRKYPSIVIECIEEKSRDIDGNEVVVDTSQPNPNGVEFDNLYLDMNGIIHPCTHPENKPAPKNEDEMMVAIFECIDRLFAIVRPRKLLYMAIDGVAPRAKMNQQRSRRFRASKESMEKAGLMEKLLEEMKNKGYKLPDKEKKESFDSNCITPGTPFMARLATALNFYIHDRLNNDPGWKGIRVVLSDASVPGEGEHKIMDYIRRQRSSPDYDPNIHHCLCGADADLIMLGLATHEAHFTIIREEFNYNQVKKCEICAQVGHEMKDCTGLENVDSSIPQPIKEEQNYIFVRLSVLREYLSQELNMPDLPFEYSFERALDDWVFMCFFVGNDFLPHLPCLEIREGAIDTLVRLYKNTVYKTGGFITDSGTVNLKRVQLILTDLARMEDDIFQRRRRQDVMFRQRNRERKNTEKTHRIQEQIMKGVPLNDIKVDDDEEPEPVDNIQLWVPGYKERYYNLKFDMTDGMSDERFKFAHYYVEGLCWVLQYYYQGVPSWNWFYPHHYAPFACDFLDVIKCNQNFEKTTKPFSPLEQLMAVFPAASSDHVPAPWATLMKDSSSPIIDFYPSDFMVDLNGKRFSWQGVALLPFVDENRLKSALERVYPKLTDEERQRNKMGDDKLYISGGADCFEDIYNLKHGTDVNGENFKSGGMHGKIYIKEGLFYQGETLVSPVRGLTSVRKNTVLCVVFKNPTYSDNYKFPAKRLIGAIDPPKTVRPGDGNPNNHRKPILGFAPSSTLARLGPSGHRALGFHTNVPRSQQNTGNHNNHRNNGRHERNGTTRNQTWQRGSQPLISVPPQLLFLMGAQQRQNQHSQYNHGGNRSNPRNRYNYGNYPYGN